MNETQGKAHVVVNFRTSSTKGGMEAYEVTVDNEATEQEVNETLRLATMARDKVKAHLDQDRWHELADQLPKQQPVVVNRDAYIDRKEQELAK